MKLGGSGPTHPHLSFHQCIFCFIYLWLDYISLFWEKKFGHSKSAQKWGQKEHSR